ncbi:MAG: AraC family transcriptional regulator [Bacteroidales bacterium]|nr:AraC family transcriptional regulator [Bacteroidales bacterium]
MKQSNFTEIGFEHIPDWIDFDYIDNDLIIYSDVKDLPFKEDVLKTAMVTIGVCFKGRMQLDINDSPYQVKPNDILICPPNAYIKNAWLSPDFECDILCLSPRVVTDFIPKNRLWDKINMLSAYPIIHVDNENRHIFELCMKMLKEKLRASSSKYKKEIVYSIVKTYLLELLENINLDEVPQKDFSRKEILYKNFMKLLSSQTIKPRSLTWYSNKLCVSPKYLSAICKEISEKTAFAWINEFVLNDIKHLLLNTDKSMKEIADYYNFPNSSFFGKYIRHHTGYSPGEYRRFLIDDRNASQI